MFNKKNIFFLLCIPYYTSPTIIWNNFMSPGSANALDEDVQINGDTWLPAETVTIQALNRNVTISMLNGPHNVYCTREDATKTTIVLTAIFPWKIDILVSEDLTFFGLENDLSTNLIIQERANFSNLDSPLIQWTVYEHKKLRFGPRDNEDFGGVDLQIVSDGFYVAPKHMFKVNGSAENPHIFFSRNSSLTFLQETFFPATAPFRKDLFFDVSNGQPRNHLVYFKDGSGFFLESAPL